MTTIKLKCTHHGWQATFRGHDRMPDNVPVLLPYTRTAPLTDVLEVLQAAFPHALYHWEVDAAGFRAVRLEKKVRRGEPIPVIPPARP